MWVGLVDKSVDIQVFGIPWLNRLGLCEGFVGEGGRTQHGLYHWYMMILALLFLGSLSLGLIEAAPGT